MAKEEAKVETYLHQEVTKLGGTTRKWVSPGRDGVPDRICILNSLVWFVEVKTLKGKLSVRQEREIETLRSHGCIVDVVYGKSDIDKMMEFFK